MLSTCRPQLNPSPPQILDSNCTVQQLSCLTTTASHFVVATVSQCALETDLLGLHLQVITSYPEKSVKCSITICDAPLINAKYRNCPCIPHLPSPEALKISRPLPARHVTNFTHLQFMIVLSVIGPCECLLLQINRKFMSFQFKPTVRRLN